MSSDQCWVTVAEWSIGRCLAVSTIAFAVLGCTRTPTETAPESAPASSASVSAATVPAASESTSETVRTSETAWAPPDLSNATLDEQVSVWGRARRESPGNKEWLLQYARTMRAVGRSSEVIQSLSPEEIEQLPALEQAGLFAEAGDWSRAKEAMRRDSLLAVSAYQPAIDTLFQSVLRGEGSQALDPTDDVQLANLILSFTGERSGGAAIQNLQLDRVARIRRIADLQTMRMIAPNETAIATMLHAVEDLQKPFTESRFMETQSPSVSSPDSEPIDRRLYRTHCAACHGIQGDGKGTASRFLEPPARNFLREPMRYVSGVRSLATDEDLRKTIAEGLQGVSMPGFPQLRSDEIDALVREVRRLQRMGLEAASKRRLQADASTSESEMDANAWVEARWRDVETLPIPKWLSEPSIATLSNDSEEVDQASVAAGADLFRKVGCHSCHAGHDSGPVASTQFNDSLGRTITARRFQNEPMRRGVDPAELYRRIFLGMPGTPHPNVEGGLSDEEIRALIDYVVTLARAASNSGTNHSRRYPSRSDVGVQR
ncbi:c-type cytochrome [Pirellulaceae bacterium SH467]